MAKINNDKILEEQRLKFEETQEISEARRKQYEERKQAEFELQRARMEKKKEDIQKAIVEIPHNEGT